jgi:hypothetical protein
MEAICKWEISNLEKGLVVGKYEKGGTNGKESNGGN